MTGIAQSSPGWSLGVRIEHAQNVERGKPCVPGFGMDEDDLQFGLVEVLKDEKSELGVGSYGAVYKAKCDELLCAAKILHRTFFQANDPGIGRVLRRFQQECRFLSRIRHPNIVQYLGLWRDPELQLPVLLMELLNESLTKFLERSTTPLPYHIQIDIAHDVALALAFLHSKDIVHRDLSSNNVLLTAGQHAKVSDFGMSKLIGDQSVGRTFTCCPGTEVYMPPEALRDPPVYTKKIDCFSFGPLAIQIITRKFPDPGPRTYQVNDAESPTGTAERPILEEERRRSHISIIDCDHSLLPIVMECLKYNHSNRPTSSQLCASISKLKEEPHYQKSRLETRCVDAGCNFQFRWKESVCAPCVMANGSATAIDKIMYVQPWGSSKVYSFDSEAKTWGELPDSHKRECCLVVVKGQVTVVGGCNDVEDFDTLTSLEVQSQGRLKWVAKLKRMPTKRYSAAAVSNEDVLIVTGGFTNGRLLSSVEIMDIECEQWYIASRLPCALYRHSAAIFGNSVYLLGGKDPSGSTTSVLKASLNLLLLRALSAKAVCESSNDTISHWKKLCRLPLSFMTSIIVRNKLGNEQLIAVGGYYSERQQRSSDLHIYNSASDAWLQAGTIISPRSSCIIAAISNDTLVIVGGKNKLGLLSNTVEITSY